MFPLPNRVLPVPQEACVLMWCQIFHKHEIQIMVFQNAFYFFSFPYYLWDFFFHKSFLVLLLLRIGIEMYHLLQDSIVDLDSEAGRPLDSCFYPSSAVTFVWPWIHDLTLCPFLAVDWQSSELWNSDEITYVIVPSSVSSMLPAIQ